MASSSTTILLIFNILFFSLTQGQETTPSPDMNSPSTSPPPAMSPENSSPPAETTPSPDMNPTSTSPPPAVNSTASSPPAVNSTASPPPPGLDCSGCRVNPIGLASCGFVTSGGVLRPLVRLCCRALHSLTREEGFACLCNVINKNAFKTRNLDIRAVIDKTLNTCSNI